jgi:hypothetical protein
MLQLMRKHHKVAMIVVAVIVCLTMVYFGQSNKDHSGSTYQVKIAGKNYDEVDLRTASAIQQMAQGAASFGNDAPTKLMGLLMSARGSTRNVKGGGEVENTLINLVTVREEAKNLGIAVSDDDVQKAVQGLQRFQTEGKFDREKFNQTAGNETAQRYFFQMMKDALLVDKLQKLVGGTMQATDYATTLDYNEAHAKTTIQTVIIPRKAHADIKATDEDAQKFYEANKEKDKDPKKNLILLDPVLRSEPSRNLSYVVFNKVKRDEKPEDTSKLPADQQAAKAKELEEKKKGWDTEDKKIVSTAIQLSNDLVNESAPKSLKDAAAAMKDKPEFSVFEVKTAENVVASAPPEDLKDAAAQLEEMIEGDQGKGVIKTATGYIVYEGAAITPSRLLTLDEAKPKLLEKLTKDKIEAALQDKATGVRSKLQEALAASKPFAEALTAAEVTATSYTYSKKNPIKEAPAFLAALQGAVTNLETGSLATNPIPAGEDLALVYLEKVELPTDPKMEDDKKLLKRSSGYTDQVFRPSPIFSSWFDQRREAAAPAAGNEP